MPKLKPGTIIPTPEEDAVINKGIAADADNPEWTKKDFARARPAKAALSEMVDADAAAEMLKPKRGRPVSDNPKAQVNIRLDAEVLAGFRATGPGWQTRLNAVLKRWLKRHSPA